MKLKVVRSIILAAATVMMVATMQPGNQKSVKEVHEPTKETGIEAFGVSPVPISGAIYKISLTQKLAVSESRTYVRLARSQRAKPGTDAALTAENADQTQQSPQTEGSGLDQTAQPVQTAQSAQPAQPAPATSAAVNAAKHYTDKDVYVVAQIMQVEARGLRSDTEVSAVGWCILNRNDYEGSEHRFPNGIIACATAPNQFAYWPDEVPTDRYLRIAGDVLARWNREQNGETSVGRTLPKDYLFFSGDGRHNYFRKELNVHAPNYRWTMQTPYAT